MARPTFLQCVNGVLRRLRQSEVASYTERAYSKLIGDFVNDAVRYVEDRHYWADLRTNTTLNLVSGTNEYALTGWADRGRLDRINITTDNISTLRSVPDEAWDKLDTTVDNARPDKYRVYLFDSNGDPRVQFYRTPDASYTAVASGWVGQGTIAADATTILVPSHPVILHAYALAIQERGEDGATSYAEARDNAEDALYRAIEREDEGQAGGRVPVWNVG